MGSKYQAYPEYKESGEEWLGSVPTHWDVIQIKRLSTVKRGASPRPIDDSKYFDDEGEYAWTRIADVTASDVYLTQAPQKLSKLGSSLSVKLEPSSLFLSIAGTVGKPCITGMKACIHDGFVYFPELKIPNKFLFYVFAGEQAYKGLGKFGTQLNLNTDTVGGIKIGCADNAELEKIVRFLDHETAKIDILIEKQQQLIKLLKEKRQAITSNAITPQLGEKTTKLGHLIDLKSGYSFQSEQFSQDEEGIRLLRGINVGVGDCRWTETVYWAGVIDHKTLEFSLEKDDIVLGMDRPWISSGTRVAQIGQEDLPCLLVQRVARIRSRAGQNQSFIRLVLECNEFRSYLEADMTGVSVPHISPEQICGFPMRVLPQSQQYQIATQAEQKFLNLDALMSEANYAIDLLQERRTALISAAVTGKIDVRDWQAPNG